MSIKDKPAFPTVLDDGCSWTQGMTLRDYFAAKALPLAWDAMKEGYFHSNEDSLNLDVAVCAYQMADAMLEARNK